MTIDDTTLANATKHLSAEEGRVKAAYQDHLGYWTIGIGRLIDARKGGGLSNDEIDFLLANDIEKCVRAMSDWPAWQAVKDDPVRATALISMCFQLGSAGLAGFRNTLAKVAAHDWGAAAQGMLASKWAQQTPARAKRVAAMMRTGVMA